MSKRNDTGSGEAIRRGVETQLGYNGERDPLPSQGRPLEVRASPRQREPVAGAGAGVDPWCRRRRGGPLITPALFSHRPPPNREKRENSQSNAAFVGFPAPL